MPEWEEPNAARSFCGEVTPLGRGLGLGLGLGLVNRRYFETATWEHLLGHEMGRFQYEQFVACMVERIRAKECSLDEIRSFVHLVASSANRDFLRLALPYLPELKEQYPHDDKHFQLALLFLIKPKLRRRSIRTLEESPADVNKSYEHGLSDREEQIIRYNMFGRDRGAVDTPGMNRLLKSTLELGYSQPGKSCKKKRFPVMRRRAHSTSAALNRSMSEAQERRTDIERCHLGLPLNLMMPAINHARARFGPPCCSRSHVAYPPTSAQLPEVPLSSVFEDDSDLDSPPPELLTELEIDGVDPPRKVTPIKTKASDGELPRITTYLEAAAFTARRAKSPDRPQAPNDAPPRPPKSYAEWMAFKAFRNEPADIFINYFYLLDPLTSHLCAKGRRPQESNLQPGPELSPDANDRYEAQFASLSSSGGETAKGLTSGTRPIPIPYPNAKAMMFPFSSQGGKLAKRPY